MANESFTILEEAARTADVVANLDNVNHRGLMIVVKKVTHTATPSMNVKLRVRGEDGLYTEIILNTATNFTNATGADSYAILFYPGANATDFDGLEAHDIPLPREFQVFFDHADADSLTYSVRGHWLD